MRHRVTLAFVFGTSMSGSAQTTPEPTGAAVEEGAYERY
jgi:hypothetical protein